MVRWETRSLSSLRITYNLPLISLLIITKKKKKFERGTLCFWLFILNNCHFGSKFKHTASTILSFLTEFFCCCVSWIFFVNKREYLQTRVYPLVKKKKVTLKCIKIGNIKFFGTPPRFAADHYFIILKKPHCWVIMLKYVEFFLF